MKDKTRQWKRVLIKDFCESIIDCVNKTASTFEGPTPYKMIRTTNVKAGSIDLINVKYVTKEIYDKWTRRAVPRKGDVILTREAPLGEVGMLRINDTIFLGQRLIQYRVDPEKLDNFFLLYSFQDYDLQAQIKSFGSGATVEHMRVPDAEKLTILLPDLLVQKKIASILSSYDDLIENNTRRIEILEQMAKLVYEEWFVKFRFPGHENVKMVPSDLGEIPEGWEVKAFSEVVDINPTRRISKGKLATKVSMADLNTWQSWINSWQKEEYGSGPKFKNGDTLFARITPSLENGKTAFVNFLSEGEIAFGSTEFIVFGPKVIESGPYIFCLSRSEYIREMAINAMTDTSGRQRVPNDCFDHLLICLPPNKIVRRFNEIVRPLFEMIKSNSKKSICLKKARDLLLPKLISGEIDVSDLDIHIRNEFQES